MTAKTTRQYGQWDSPITPRGLSEDKRLDAARWDSDGQALVHLEGRSGRGVLVVHGPEGEAPRDLTAELNVRAEVGYGGGDFTVHGGCVYFVVHKTGRLYRQPLAGGPARPITPPHGQTSSPVVSPDGKWIAYVHHDGEQTDRLAVVDTAGRCWPQILAGGHDFYMQPRWSPDGTQLCWISWDHPQMPWDESVLRLAPIVETGVGLPSLAEARVVAGGSGTAIFQAEFSLDGRSLFYISDESGWGRIAVHDLQSGQRRWLSPEGVEHATPAWVQDMRTYAVLHDGRSLVAARSEQGFASIQRIDVETGECAPVEALAQYTDVAQLCASPIAERIVFLGSSPTVPPRVVMHDFVTGRSRVIARSSGETVAAAALARCEAISWNTADGETAHGLYYAPASDRFQCTGKPPLIVSIHGGPTSQVRAAWKADAQFFATRGYAVLLVNYRGSTGYGRQYMLRLRGNWGICDVQDAISGMKHLAESGKIDPRRTVIIGGSAGGFTVLQAMTQQPEAFTAGICLYGVADQFHLARQTHKFESRYLDSLLGPLPEAAEIYRQRSPVFHAERICRPLAVFQGAIDRVVPREQSDKIVEALKRNGTPHMYHVYEDEGHGWRKRETIEHYYRTVEEFLYEHVLYT